MLIVFDRKANEAQVQGVVDTLREAGYEVHRSTEAEHPIVGAIGRPRRGVDPRVIEATPGVRSVVTVAEPCKLTGRGFRSESTTVDVAGVILGGREVVVMAGPCAVESPEQVVAVARHVQASGARVLRGGAFKPRTSPYSFQGHGEDALKWLREASQVTGLPVVSEVTDVRTLDLLLRYVDCLQVGSRNQQNFELLRALGTVSRPVLLKRGMAATIEEWLLAAEYILMGGNSRVILCERGIRTFERSTRNTVDISAIPMVKRLSHLPIIVDPSHGTGRRESVAPLARAAVAAGADGLLIEVHDEPERALCDGAESLYPQQFEQLMKELRGIAGVTGRTLSPALALAP